MRNKVLVAGASGVVGAAAVEAFLREGWEVVALSRRAPEIAGSQAFTHLAVDLQDAAASRAALGALSGVTHLVYTALFEKPGLIAGWQEQDQMNTNLQMLKNCLEPLEAAGNPLQHVSLLQGTKAYGAHLHLKVPLPARERAPRDDHENFYWLQEDDLRAMAEANGFAWTIFRPQIIVGAAWGAAMNPLIAIAAYAAIRHELGLGLPYPGGAAQVMELVDPRLLGEAFVWAAGALEAVGETFNVTNGDVYAWQEVWPALAGAFGMTQGADEPLRVAPFLAEHAHVWDRLVQRHGLRPIAIDALVGESHHYIDALLRANVEQLTPPILVSTIKLRRAGFGNCFDSEDTLTHWLRVLSDRKLIPPLPYA